MELVTISNAAKLSGLSDSSLRNYLDNGTLNKYENEKGRLCVDKMELLKLVPVVLAVFNQKGGCGKTSLSVLLSDYYEKKQMKALLIDLDQQGNLSQTFFPYEELRDSLSLYDYFENKTPISKIVRTYNDYIDVLPSTIKLSRINNNFDVPELTLMKNNDFNGLLKKYNIVIIDCPPSVNSFSKFGLILANYVVIPVVPEAYDYDGLFEVMNTINLYKKFIDGFIDFKVVISRHDQRNTVIQEGYIDKIKAQLKNRVSELTIPTFVGIKERATMIKGNIFTMYPDSHRSMDRIKSVLDEIDELIYNNRPVI